MARSQSLFREINERIRQLAVSTNSDPPGLICECARTECVEDVAITRSEYDGIREVQNWFVLKPGHEDLTTERVVRRNDRYVIVGKMDALEKASSPFSR